MRRETSSTSAPSLYRRKSGYSANISFAASAPRTASQLTHYAAVGLMTGAADPMMRFPAGTIFTPYSVLGNASNQPLVVTPTVYWMQAGTSHSAQLQQVTLAPQSLSDLNAPGLLGAAGLTQFNGDVNLELDVQGPSHSLLFAAGSVDQKNTYVFAVASSTIKESVAKELAYWSTGNGDDTMVTVWNPSSEAQDFTFTLFFTGGHYGLPVHLEAKASRSFDISELTNGALPDVDGNMVPASVHDGSAQLSGSQGEAEHILVVFDAGTYNVQKATCVGQCKTCLGAVDSWITDDPFSLVVGGNKQQSLKAQYHSGTIFDETQGATWTSNATAVATVNSNGLVQGLSPGSLTLFASNDGVPDYSSACYAYAVDCPVYQGVEAQASGNVTCATPTNFQQTVGRDAGSGSIYFEYTWTSSSGSNSDLGGCSVYENVTYPGPYTTYTFPSPPFPAALNVNNPTVNGVPGSDGILVDTNSTPGTFRTPFPIGLTSVTANQIFQYSCGCASSGAAIQLYPSSGSLAIVRTVNATSTSTGTYSITKSGVSSSKSVP